jgi:hypothetical protein
MEHSDPPGIRQARITPTILGFYCGGSPGSQDHLLDGTKNPPGLRPCEFAFRHLLLTVILRKNVQSPRAYSESE